MTIVTTFLSEWVATILAFQLTLSQEMSLVGAGVVTLIGAWLCWTSPRYRMEVEEHVKDGKMTSDEAFRKIQRSQWLGPAVTILGVALLVYFLTRE